MMAPDGAWVCASSGIIVEDVTLSYDGRLVLGGVSLNLKKGEVIVLLGPNGCGKTSLLKVINGMLRPDSGKVYLDCMEAAGLGPKKLARLMGHVPQSQGSSFPFSVMDIVLTGRLSHISALSQPGPKDVEVAERALQMVGASDLSERPFTRISGGERQLVMIARALAQEPSYLLLDEPTSSLDFRNQYRVLRMISRIAGSQNVTVVMTLHDPNHAMMFSDEVVLLRKLEGAGDSHPGNPHRGNSGLLRHPATQNVVAFGAAQEVLNSKNILDAYGMDVDVLDVQGRRILFPR